MTTIDNVCVLSFLATSHPHTVAMASLAEPYSQASLTFLDTDIGLEYGVDTQGDFDHYEFTLPSQSQTQTQPSQLTQGGVTGTTTETGACVASRVVKDTSVQAKKLLCVYLCILGSKQQGCKRA